MALAKDAGLRLRDKSGSTFMFTINLERPLDG
jgi:hypothetical protein